MTGILLLYIGYKLGFGWLYISMCWFVVLVSVAKAVGAFCAGFNEGMNGKSGTDKSV